MQAYNERIFREGQTGMTDAWSDVDTSFDFEGTGLADEMAGYITIPAMDVELPLYIGAGAEHLEKGAAVLAQTSMPIGGENTNCVIAAHRGYGGKAMFREIERLVPGDRVEITNLWETLSYEVVKCIVIYPDDTDAVKIIPGEDMVTLVTCHPYTENYQRYVVYCVRTDGSGEEASGAEGNGADKNTVEENATPGAAQTGNGEETEAGTEIPWEGVDYEPSEQKIRREKLLGLAGILVFSAVYLAAVIFFAGGGKRGKKDRKNGGKQGEHKGDHQEKGPRRRHGSRGRNRRGSTEHTAGKKTGKRRS